MQVKLFSVMAICCLYHSATNATTITMFQAPACERCNEIKSFIKDKFFENQDSISINLIDATKPDGILLFNKFSQFCKCPDNVSMPVVIIDEKCYFGDSVSGVFSNSIFASKIQKAQEKTRIAIPVESEKSVSTKPKENILYAPDLFKEYQANKFAFNQKYDNKHLTVRGEVSRVDADGNVSLATSSLFYDITCFVQNKDKVLTLSEKQTITVSGVFKRETNLFDLELYNCVIK